jgi:hypothetical protein
MNRRKVALGIVVGEITVLLLLVANAWLQFDRDEDRVVRQSKVVGVRAADEARAFFRDHPDQRSREAGESFLLDLIARRAPAPNETGEEWEPIFRDAQHSAGADRASAGGLTAPQVRRDGRVLSISIPLGTAADAFGGVLLIQHDRRMIAEHSVLDPAWVFFQLVLFVFLSFQVCLTFIALARRDRVTVFEKGYLKEHAIGALKLQHRLLGQIIRDHEEEEQPQQAPPVRPVESGRGKVIQMDKAARKPAEDRGPRR